MLIADTITDEQIRELHRDADKQIAMCNDALRTDRTAAALRKAARAWLAEILNARIGR